MDTAIPEANPSLAANNDNSPSNIVLFTQPPGFRVLSNFPNSNSNQIRTTGGALPPGQNFNGTFFAQEGGRGTSLDRFSANKRRTQATQRTRTRKPQFIRRLWP